MVLARLNPCTESKLRGEVLAFNNSRRPLHVLRETYRREGGIRLRQIDPGQELPTLGGMGRGGAEAI